MPKSQKIVINHTNISITQIDKEDYICLTDMARYKNPDATGLVISHWLSTRYTVEFMGIWETINNPDFNITEFSSIKNQSGSNGFVLSSKQWIERTSAIGIRAKTGRYSGGTFAHKDIAFEFASWLSPEFKFYLIREFQRLKADENDKLQIEWSVKRLLSKTNYHLQTEAIQKNLLLTHNYSSNNQWIAYAEEADILNVALFGCTAKDWREANTSYAEKNLNIRDFASINELTVLSNLESMNSILIHQGVAKTERFKQLQIVAQHQLFVLNNKENQKALKKNAK
ncbi:MAG: KilA-N domain-containing protein [Bacteroidetes bacterium]|nr:KilA-N domain-containing protein [Bacteroidota bacterium]MBU1719580.1 KilA-N domain-containing protein [Bacteroidota bacterium]